MIHFGYANYQSDAFTIRQAEAFRMILKCKFTCYDICSNLKVRHIADNVSLEIQKPLKKLHKSLYWTVSWLIMHRTLLEATFSAL